MSDKVVCFVTGVAGFTGRNLVEELLNKGYFVVGIDNFSTGKEENIEDFFKNKNFVFSEVDIRDIDALNGLFLTYSPEIVFHLAWSDINDDSEILETTRNNVYGTLNLLEISRKYNIKRFVFASSSSVYGIVNVDLVPEYEEKKPHTISALQKSLCESFCSFYHRYFSLKTICLRLFSVYGPYQNTITNKNKLIPKTIRKCLDYEQPEIYGDGFQMRDFVYVKDVVRAFLRAGTTDNEDCFGECFNVGSGVKTTVRYIVREIQIQTDTTELDPICDASEQTQEYLVADIEKAKKILDWSPMVDLPTGLKRTIEYFK